MTFTAHLRQEAEALFQASFDHPFVRELGTGNSTRPNFDITSCKTRTI